ncbi:hypothetical protein KKF84_12125, partial [Myxococcota bacterium]|nr:hypothetical protein [Myxococcota bacterium]MBU1536061.1 hypothetical protein [Myxococcota bacterium]
MNNTDRYCSFSIRTDCPHCGNPLPLNGPLKAPVCSSCQQTVELPERVLHRAMVYYGEAFDAPGGTYGPSSELPSGFTIKHTICVEQPLCGRCGEALPVADINTDTNGTM